MRVVLSVSAMLVGLLGTYLVGTGVFLPGNAPPGTWWEPILIPFASPHPLSWLLLTVSVALAFFGVAVAGSTRSRTSQVRTGHILLFGGTFSVLTAAGFAALLFFLWRQGGTSAHNLGLVFSLAAIQACLGLILGGGATIAGRGFRHVTVPVMLLGAIETAAAGALLFYGTSL
ncbi:MAG TPA: hypothetical protein DCM87_18115 [Planctomycetes bacterium]|nr:hypothetical protein [Planctomycetota bacterium]